MNLDKLLEEFKDGNISKKKLKDELNLQEISKLGDFAKIDTDRSRRVGVPEAILGDGKSPKEFAEIMKKMVENKGIAIGTRVSQGQLNKIREVEGFVLDWYEKADIAVLRSGGYESPEKIGSVGVLSAGTADIDVAEEARVIAELLGAETKKAYDVGVAGIHRLFPELKELIEKGMDVLVVAAGRDGSLPPVVAGVVDIPVIGLPTSTGYGLGGKGKGALFSMLQSCSLLSVVNIDAGFTAGAMAVQMLKVKER